MFTNIPIGGECCQQPARTRSRSDWLSFSTAKNVAELAPFPDGAADLNSDEFSDALQPQDGNSSPRQRRGDPRPMRRTDLPSCLIYRCAGVKRCSTGIRRGLPSPKKNEFRTGIFKISTIPCDERSYENTKLCVYATKRAIFGVGMSDDSQILR